MGGLSGMVCISDQPGSLGTNGFCMATMLGEVLKSISQMDPNGDFFRWFTMVESRKSLQIQGNE